MSLQDKTAEEIKDEIAALERQQKECAREIALLEAELARREILMRAPSQMPPTRRNKPR
jgi:hypothetical protein